ncbi:hypothetical protein IE53DRAFT_390678 [Violaceomyces palustris]|uniref:Uncharacterized protein n=1 Tax=Violaceomyces palustris TaxID=1673888 RepID=A0ACD0NMV6_9BASI|nr:hypothetical protein IE53DRAFT_390678 [Violaceomyces palustris]
MKKGQDRACGTRTSLVFSFLFLSPLGLENPVKGEEGGGDKKQVLGQEQVEGSSSRPRPQASVSNRLPLDTPLKDVSIRPDGSCS